jgi:hypothetical protein
MTYVRAGGMALMSGHLNAPKGVDPELYEARLHLYTRLSPSEIAGDLAELANPRQIGLVKRIFGPPQTRSEKPEKAGHWYDRLNPFRAEGLVEAPRLVLPSPITPVNDPSGRAVLSCPVCMGKGGTNLVEKKRIGLRLPPSLGGDSTKREKNETVWSECPNCEGKGSFSVVPLIEGFNFFAAEVRRIRTALQYEGRIVDVNKNVDQLNARIRAWSKASAGE